MGAQSSKPLNEPQHSPRSINEKSHSQSHSSQARADAASTAALMSRLRLSSSRTGPHPSPELTLDNFTAWQNAFDRDDKAQLASTLLSKSGLATSLIRRNAVTADQHIFSHNLSCQPTPVTNQKSSGRCWLFATCNVIRVGIVKNFNLGDFELSQSYLFFYDSLEKANYFLESIIDLIEEPIDSRIISHLSSGFEGDGGQWDMVVGLIEKYGVVPKAVYGESYHSSYSSGLKTLITSQVRDYAIQLRKLYHDSVSHSVNVLGHDPATAEAEALIVVRRAKEIMMEKVYRCLAIAFGPPPAANSSFKWEYEDVNGKAHSLTSTPLEFYHRHCAGFKAADYISVINDPRHDYDQAYTVDRLGNVWGGRSIRYVNTTSDVLKKLVVKMIKADKPVWFGCDVGKMSSTSYGIMDTDLIDYEGGLGVTLTLSKSQRLQIGESAMTHAMVFTGVHLNEKGDPVRFKVENSWSDTAGDHGYFIMTSQWFDEYLYQIVLPKDVVPARLRDVYDNSKPNVLPPWDPMGSLA